MGYDEEYGQNGRNPVMKITAGLAQVADAQIMSWQRKRASATGRK